MERAIFYNLKNLFPVYDIINSQTFEPEFKEWGDSELSEIDKYRVIFFYMPHLDLELIKTMRTSLHFMNSKLFIFCVSLDLIEKEEAIKMGATNVSLLPTDVDEMIMFLQNIKHSLDSSGQYNADKLTPFKAAVEEIFLTMAVTEIELVEEYYCTERLHFGEVSGVMALAGKKKGSVILTINQDFAKKIISNI
ncbi:MAG: hypothetical protein PHR06_04585, partial [Candidatus Cloacimonetes bacterium]|nr:hypothetical protein [Candidatus Cloacimonadota bacterium]